MKEIEEAVTETRIVVAQPYLGACVVCGWSLPADPSCALCPECAALPGKARVICMPCTEYGDGRSDWTIKKAADTFGLPAEEGITIRFDDGCPICCPLEEGEKMPPLGYTVFQLCNGEVLGQVHH